MHLPTGPTAVYHHHHHHHHAASQLSPPNSDWTLNNNNNNNINNNLKIGGGNGSSNSILEPPTSSGTSSPPGSNSSASQDLWWTERLILEAQQEFPGELGKCISLHDRKCQRTNFLLDTRATEFVFSLKSQWPHPWPWYTSFFFFFIFIFSLYRCEFNPMMWTILLKPKFTVKTSVRATHIEQVPYAPYQLPCRTWSRLGSLCYSSTCESCLNFHYFIFIGQFWCVHSLRVSFCYTRTQRCNSIHRKIEIAVSYSWAVIHVRTSSTPKTCCAMLSKTWSTLIHYACETHSICYRFIRFYSLLSLSQPSLLIHRSFHFWFYFSSHW